MDDAEPSPSLEERRKYRQTLVDIQDDVVFHQVLQDLARLEKQEDDEREKSPTSEGAHGSEVREEWKPDKGEIRAWFVTRELVQGERRHGRLLARGVAVSLSMLRERGDELIFRRSKRQQRVEGMKSHHYPYLVHLTNPP